MNNLYTKEQILQAAKDGEVSMIDVEHIVGILEKQTTPDIQQAGGMKQDIQKLSDSIFEKWAVENDDGFRYLTLPCFTLALQDKELKELLTTPIKTERKDNFLLNLLSLTSEYYSDQTRPERKVKIIKELRDAYSNQFKNNFPSPVDIDVETLAKKYANLNSDGEGYAGYDERYLAFKAGYAASLYQSSMKIDKDNLGGKLVNAMGEVNRLMMELLKLSDHKV